MEWKAAEGVKTKRSNVFYPWSQGQEVYLYHPIAAAVQPTTAKFSGENDNARFLTGLWVSWLILLSQVRL